VDCYSFLLHLKQEKDELMVVIPNNYSPWMVVVTNCVVSWVSGTAKTSVESVSLKCLWTENCFSLVFKFALQNTRFQSLRSLGLKLSILQAFKFVPFGPQKWYLNRAAKIPRDINFWRHFGATIVLAIWRTRKKRGSEGGITLLVHETNKAAFGIAGHVFFHILSLANKKLWQCK